MKKILALVAVVALVAFAAPAFANVNPFMDVPMNHWAYDAIGQLAARGVLSGYPDGTYKGNQPMTRYEAASAVARALAVVDMTKASKQDVEMLKRLVVEFKDELDALGVKVDKIDSRLAVIEDRLGGWQMWGAFRFDAEFGGNNNHAANAPVGEVPRYGITQGNRFRVSRYRLFMRRHIDDKVTFTARMGGAGNAFERYYLDVKLPWDISMMVGAWEFPNWQIQDRLSMDWGAGFTDIGAERGFYFTKPFAMGNFDWFVTRSDENNDNANPLNTNERYEYGARVKLNINEQIWMSANAMFMNYDSNVQHPTAGVDQEDEHVYWGAVGVNFTPDISLAGAYYKQKVHRPIAADPTNTETPGAWQAVIRIAQPALKFTSFAFEYWGYDEFFTEAPWGRRDGNSSWRYWIASGDPFGAALGANYTNIMGITLNQRWTDQWTTFQRYIHGSARNDLASNTTNWNIGARYNYTPSLSFTLEYDRITGNQTVDGADDSLIRFRTFINF